MSFEQLREKRLRYVVSARENNFEEGLKSLLSELYPDNAHFIYELLQNAEDAKAQTVEFALSPDQLTVTHDGQRPFSLEDIDSITGIGQSTKTDDPTQIGKFGVGFKAVFAYTMRPQIRSGEHSFAIVDLFVPESIDGLAEGGKTTFAFPFDREEKPADLACHEVERGLTELNEQTLLFLTNISTITYELPDGSVGIIERRAIDERIISIRKSEGDDFVESHWLRLVGPTSATHTGPAQLTVAAAFQLRQRNSPKRKSIGPSDASHSPGPAWSIEPLQSGDVCIYFPAVKESSGLRFHIHAPFASTVARDSVRNDPSNVQLVSDLASLIAEALPELCAEGLIEESFLATLPNQDDPLAHPYTLIREAVRDAFNHLPITPIWNSSTYAPARELVSSPPEFRNWLDVTDLPELFRLADINTKGTPRWIRDRDGRAGRFLKGLQTRAFGWDELEQVVGNLSYNWDNEYLPDFLAWLQTKTDKRLLDLYQLLGRGTAASELSSSYLEDVPLIRLRQRGQVKHVKGSETHLPSGRRDTAQTRVPVELAYFDDDEDAARANNLRQFYAAAGVRRWDESAKVQKRLDHYKGRERPVPDNDEFARYLDDVRLFVQHGLNNRRHAKAMFRSVPFLLADQSDGSLRWVSPKDTFLDIPFRDTGFSALYPRVKLYWKGGGGYAYDQGPYALAGHYLNIEGIEEFLEAVEAIVAITIDPADVADNPEYSWSWRIVNRENANGERVDWTIRNLEEMLQSGNESLLRMLWLTVVETPTSKGIATYRANGSSPRYRVESQLVQALKARPWIRDRDGILRLARDMTVDDLPESWPSPPSHSLVHKLDFGAEAARRRQQKQGVTDYLRQEGLDEDGIDVLREAKDAGLTVAQIREMVRERTAMESFPSAASDDPGRRASIAESEAKNAPKYETTLVERTVAEGRYAASAESKTYLRGQYTTPSGEMFCQACHKPLPFRTKDGSWYFEAVRFLPDRKYVHTANCLSLCPLCAALYKYARDTTDETLLEELAALSPIPGQGNCELPVILNMQRVSVRFTGKHAIDLKSALHAAGHSRGSIR